MVVALKQPCAKCGEPHCSRAWGAAADPARPRTARPGGPWLGRCTLLSRNVDPNTGRGVWEKVLDTKVTLFWCARLLN